ncbi:MAG: hypothetical protein P9M03_02820, partial [Candidatus Theseobacter exili]|nr:hypothetical protein [Candidatus Theseobacter exili]
FVIMLLGLFLIMTFPGLKVYSRKVRLKDCAIKVEGIIRYARRAGRHFGKSSVFFGYGKGKVSYMTSNGTIEKTFNLPERIKIELDGNDKKNSLIVFNHKGYCLPASVVLKEKNDSIVLEIEPYINGVNYVSS